MAGPAPKPQSAAPAVGSQLQCCEVGGCCSQLCQTGFQGRHARAMNAYPWTGRLVAPHDDQDALPCTFRPTPAFASLCCHQICTSSRVHVSEPSEHGLIPETAGPRNPDYLRCLDRKGSKRLQAVVRIFAHWLGRSQLQASPPAEAQASVSVRMKPRSAPAAVMLGPCPLDVSPLQGQGPVARDMPEPHSMPNGQYEPMPNGHGGPMPNGCSEHSEHSKHTPNELPELSLRASLARAVASGPLLETEAVCSQSGYALDTGLMSSQPLRGQKPSDHSPLVQRMVFLLRTAQMLHVRCFALSITPKSLEGGAASQNSLFCMIRPEKAICRSIGCTGLGEVALCWPVLSAFGCLGQSMVNMPAPRVAPFAGG